MGSRYKFLTVGLGGLPGDYLPADHVAEPVEDPVLVAPQKLAVTRRHAGAIYCGRKGSITYTMRKASITDTDGERLVLQTLGENPVLQALTEKIQYYSISFSFPSSSMPFIFAC